MDKDRSVSASACPSLADAEVESIERATLDAVVPDRLECLPGWLLPMFDGTVGRARSAVPLQHVQADPADIESIVGRYRAQGYSPAFRLPDSPSFNRFHAHLRRQGFLSEQPTLTMIGQVENLLKLHAGPLGELQAKADAQWMDMFLGPGLDPVDGASRARALSRATNTLFASVREAERTVASGAAAFGHGWLSVHGMRTHAAHRGQGHARRVLATMAEEALQRGVTKVFLQVDAANVPAIALYRRAGMVIAWAYSYWRPAA
ncbi:MAG: GNAT family N-acetyltransferase [Comamonadaceae bacterium]|nr:GNAT family N-acetyltransferase [Comamonadaceae bacterium]